MSEVVTTTEMTELKQIIDGAERRWDVEFDDNNTLNDWGTYVNVYIAKATATENRSDASAQYDALMKAAGLALTAAARVKAGRVAPRHYDFQKANL